MTQVIGKVQRPILVIRISKSVRCGEINVLVSSCNLQLTSKPEEGIRKSNASQSCRNVTVPQNNNLVNEGVYLGVLIMELHKGENKSSQEHSLKEKDENDVNALAEMIN